MTDAPGGDRGVIAPDTDRLLLDVMLGKLAVYFRVCGYDAAYALDRGIEDDDRLATLAEGESRRLLTRDVELAASVDGAVLVTALELNDQLAELREAGFALAIADLPTHCGRCNGILDPVPSESETPEYAPDPASTDCWRCRSCGQVFWKGSHYDRIDEMLG
ncbi:Mut7-C RNAse domain-containing protein [Natronomonas salsuginis]|uniref:Mut7-C RNAse domain-containing protein n=1 Tax=Natronomonas salsuginis TaxID=2217661 RepID=A0A4U5J9I9_9EURY|nr:Mut7-C RNAse domain-containing protein [Natronomonas salsuginis]TKR24378.1 hypothetical protein DM868_14790 [Natronomonas salsuginis]